MIALLVVMMMATSLLLVASSMRLTEDAKEAAVTMRRGRVLICIEKQRVSEICSRL